VLSEHGSVSSPVGISAGIGVTGAHYLCTSSTPAPMHFHFSNANCSFTTNEMDSNRTPSISETALKGCDLTMSSSISTHSGVKTGNITGNKLRAPRPRRSIDPPELDAKLHYSGSRSGSSHTGSESSSKRRERKARMLPSSRVLNGHAPEEWPPGMITGKDNVQLHYEVQDSGSFFTGSESSSKGRGRKACMLSPSRVLPCHAPEEWPPSESTSSVSSSSRHDKENNGWVSNQYQDQYTKRHSNIGTRQQLSVSQPHRLYDDEHNSVDSNPPPDFYPRKEIIHAVKCHEEMGRALSKLALNTEINSAKLGADYSVTSTALMGASTFESFSTNSFRLGAMHKRLNDQRSVHQRDYATSTGAPNTWTYSDEIGLSGSACSASVSAKSDGSSFFQHVSFLEGLEEHIKTYNQSELISDHQTNFDVPDEEAPTFFPTFYDLRSPPSGHVPSKYTDYSFSNEIISQPVLSQTPQNYIQDVHSLSPPKTPSLICSFSSSDKMNYPSIDGQAILQGISQIKEETTIMLNGLESKLKSDLRELLEEEIVQIKSIVSENSHIESSEPEQKCKPNSSFTDASPFSSCKMSTRNAMTPPPQPNNSLHTIDRNVLSEVIQKSMRSMESSILDKITMHMNKDALHQRAYLEEMIDEKVTKVMVGQNLEMQMAMGEMKRAAKKLAKQTVASRSVMESNANAVITPARHLTPIKHARNSTPISDSKEMPAWGMKREPSIKVLEDSFADTMKVIDDFVSDCDGLVSDFDKIAFKMEDSSDAD